MSIGSTLRKVFYSLIRIFAKLIFTIFYRDHGAFHRENFPEDDGTPILFIAAPHGNFLMDAITIFVACPRSMYFLSAKANFNYPIFGTVITILGCIPVTRPQDVERVNGDGLVKVIEEGKVVEGEGLGKVLQVGDNLYVEFEGPDNNEMLNEACGTVEEIINENQIRIKDPGMKWLTKGRKKGKFRRLVEYGSVVIRVERGTTLKTLEGLNFIPKSVSQSVSRSWDRFSSSPGKLPFLIKDDQPDEIVVYPQNPEATERTPLLVANVYSAVYNHFSKSQCVAIFPEGTSHDNEHMLSLKYGCAVMSLGYLASREPDSFGNEKKLKIVPCGLNFFNRHRFRSRVFVDVGPPIEIESRLVELYRSGSEGKRQACQELLKTIQTSLSELTVNAPDYFTLLFFKTASRLYRESLPNELSFPKKLALLRKIAKKYTANTPPTDEARKLKYDVVAYIQKLRNHRLSPPHMSTTPISLFFYLPLFIILVVLTIPGFVLFFPIGIIAKYVGKKQGENAMLYDDNSLAITRWPGRDVIATWKMMSGLVLFITFDVIYTAIMVHFIKIYDLYECQSRKDVFLLGLCIYTFFWTAIAYATILSWERMCWVGKRVWVGIWSLFNPRERQSLTSWKKELTLRVCRWVENDD
ncbi:7180_t:CDS:2 [Funneliformis mosseae]|uniref:7180_t:CDS:1 n=1 Tax=Funneliformis mosseae TaxID=27381 RepID=A0A9N9F0C1_FUNMO|nr:7180_t:CDS:2 [Funneliformis mosseae]